MALSQVGLERLNTATTDKIGKRKNKIINGAMQVAQRGTSDSGITSSEYADGPDRFKLGGSSFGTVTVSQSTDSPNDFGNSYKVDVTTANGSLSAGSLLEIQTSLEGQDVQDFAKGTSDAKQYALSFHVKSTKNGTYVVMLFDHDNNRMVCKTYTVSDANWNRYTLIFPADTTGAFDNDNAKSFSVKFVLVAGTTFTSGTLQTTWGSSSNADSRVGQVNFADSTSNDWYVTGVQLEVGSVATDFEHRSFGQELALCQRYYYRETIQNAEYFNGLGKADSDGNSIDLNLKFPVTMRTTPSAVEQTGDGNNYLIRGSSTLQCTGVPTYGDATQHSATIRFTRSSHSISTNNVANCGSWGGSYLGFSAEL
jgi:hypothetical protein